MGLDTVCRCLCGKSQQAFNVPEQMVGQILFDFRHHAARRLVQAFGKHFSKTRLFELMPVCLGVGAPKGAAATAIENDFRGVERFKVAFANVARTQ